MDVPRDRSSAPTSCPSLAQRVDELRLRRDRAVADESEDRLLADGVAHREHLAEDRERLVDLGLGDDERRQEPEHVRARR